MNEMKSPKIRIIYHYTVADKEAGTESDRYRVFIEGNCLADGQLLRLVLVEGKTYEEARKLAEKLRNAIQEAETLDAVEGN